MVLIILLQAPTGSGLMSFLPILLIIFVFYFFMIRPQVNRQKEEDKFRSEIKKGDKIVTIGGIHGKVNNVKESKVILEISDNNKITVDINAISKEKSINTFSNKWKTYNIFLLKKPYKIGLTGGIGAGKTTVAKIFQTLGVPVFNSDEYGKHLLSNNKIKSTW